MMLGLLDANWAYSHVYILVPYSLFSLNVGFLYSKNSPLLKDPFQLTSFQFFNKANISRQTSNSFPIVFIIVPPILLKPP